MKQKDALVVLDELHKLPARHDDWTRVFLEDIDFEVRIGKKNLSPKQGAKLMEIYEKTTEGL